MTNISLFREIPELWLETNRSNSCGDQLWRAASVSNAMGIATYFTLLANINRPKSFLARKPRADGEKQESTRLCSHQKWKATPCEYPQNTQNEYLIA